MHYGVSRTQPFSESQEREEREIRRKGTRNGEMKER